MRSALRKRSLGVSGALAVAVGILVVAASPTGASTGWSIVSSPNASSNDMLLSVSCFGPTHCMTVGWYHNGIALQTLVEEWNGAKWSIIPSPNPAGSSHDNALSGVSCPRANHCVAVGGYFNGVAEQTLVETWNGTAWSVTPSPTPVGWNGYLASVSCARGNHCVTVGDYYNYYASPTVVWTLIETWNGTAWSVTPSPNRGVGINTLAAVSCTRDTNCVAVGGYDSPGLQTLVETWNGTRWSITPSPNQGNNLENDLTGVSCTSTANCTAVGFYVLEPLALRTLVETWNGITWSIVPSPNAGATGSSLHKVSCKRTNRCVAVGFSSISTGFVERTLVETWNGITWSILPSPNQGNTGNVLAAAACSRASECVAVGWYNAPSGAQSLVLMQLVPTTGSQIQRFH